MTNEELVVRIQAGNAEAQEQLLTNNVDYLRALARKLTRDPDLIEDLQQEGAIAILNAASGYDVRNEVLFLTYATPLVRASMHNFMAQMSLPLAVPSTRYNQLRRVGYIAARAQGQNIIGEICKELRVSEKVARKLVEDNYQRFVSDEMLEQETIPDCFESDPAGVYEQRLLLFCIEEALRSLPARERNLIQYHLGLNQPNEKGMTFQELAIRLNYNSHSAAEKAYNRALVALREKLYTIA